MNFDNFEDFQVYFWQYINENIVSPEDIYVDNKDFCESVCFDCFRVYQKGNLNLDTICKLAENILFSVYRFKPLLGN